MSAGASTEIAEADIPKRIGLDASREDRKNFWKRLQCHHHSTPLQTLRRLERVDARIDPDIYNNVIFLDEALEVCQFGLQLIAKYINAATAKPASIFPIDDRPVRQACLEEKTSWRKGNAHFAQEYAEGGQDDTGVCPTTA
jgi:hypothetical protein